MKRIAYLVLALICLLLCAAPAMAEDSQVIYSGNAGEFIFLPGTEEWPTDLFPEFKGVSPGDVLEQKILLKNNISKNVKIEVYLRAKGYSKGSEEFLSKLNLTIRQSDDALLFSAPSDQPAQLTDWTHLGSLESGGRCELTLVLEVPVTLGDEFQGHMGVIEWEFWVNATPVGPIDPSLHWCRDLILWPFIVLMVLSLAGMITVIWVKNRKE